MYDKKTESLRKRQRRTRKCQAAVDIQGNKCADCGKTFPICCYDFHHVGPKEREVGRMVHADMKLDLILEEARKCVLLCACCHRIRHAV